MADTSIAITAGSGTSIDTRTEGTNGNHRQVIVVGDPATNAGVAPVDATAGLKVDLGADNDVVTTGSVAHDAVDSGNPQKIGGFAETSISGRTMVADADRTDAVFGVDGVQINRPHTNLEDIVSGISTVTDGSSTSTISAQGSGIKVYITTVVIANSSSTNVTVDLRDGTAGSVKATFPVPANSGVVISLPVPLGFSANTAIAADPSASATSVITTLIGFKSKI